MKKHRVFLVRLFLMCLIGAVIGVAYTFIVIYMGVKTTITQAKRLYNDTCVNSLIRLISSESATYKEKNHAVWALGQLADKQALPFLTDLYTGSVLPKKPYDQMLSQYELKKAITWSTKGNGTAWMYRNCEAW